MAQHPSLRLPLALDSQRVSLPSRPLSGLDSEEAPIVECGAADTRFETELDTFDEKVRYSARCHSSLWFASGVVLVTGAGR
jgi:hypothetical protein